MALISLYWHRVKIYGFQRDLLNYVLSYPFVEFWMHLRLASLRLSINIFKENDYRTITLDTSYDAFPAARAVATQPRAPGE